MQSAAVAETKIFHALADPSRRAIFESQVGASGSRNPAGSRPHAKVCVRCFGVMPPHVAACRLCDTVFPPSVVPLLAPERDGTLSRVAVDQATKDAAWETILKVAAGVGADAAELPVLIHRTREMSGHDGHAEVFGAGRLSLRLMWGLG